VRFSNSTAVDQYRCALGVVAVPLAHDLYWRARAMLIYRSACRRWPAARSLLAAETPLKSALAPSLRAWRDAVERFRWIGFGNIATTHGMCTLAICHSCSRLYVQDCPCSLWCSWTNAYLRPWAKFTPASFVESIVEQRARRRDHLHSIYQGGGVVSREANASKRGTSTTTTDYGRNVDMMCTSMSNRAPVDFNRAYNISSTRYCKSHHYHSPGVCCISRWLCTCFC